MQMTRGILHTLYYTILRYITYYTTNYLDSAVVKSIGQRVELILDTGWVAFHFYRNRALLLLTSTRDKGPTLGKGKASLLIKGN